MKYFLHSTIKSVNLVLKNNKLPMYIQGLIIIPIEPSYSCVKKLKPYGTGETKNSFKESNEMYAENIFQLLVKFFFFFFCMLMVNLVSLTIFKQFEKSLGYFSLESIWQTGHWAIQLGRGVLNRCLLLWYGVVWADLPL